ncbi:MAG TPA: radical SAM protein [Patescibacteria group bacterium]
MTNKINHNLIDAVIGTTYICNSRCIMCNIWQIKDQPTLTLADYRKLPKTLKYINISGGEAFMHPEIVEIVRVTAETCHQAKLTISTNGFSTDLILDRMKQILEFAPEIGVSISLDGIGEKQYEVRRIPDGYEKIMRTFKGLQKLGIANSRLRLAFTAGDYNIEHLSKVYDLTRELGIEMTLAAVHNSDNYFMIATNKITRFDEFKKEFDYVIKQELKTFKPKRWLRAYFTYGLYKFVTTGKRILPYMAGRNSFYLDPDGWVFSTTVATKRMGNLKEFNSLEDLMDASQAQEVLANDTEGHNWMICTTRAAMKSHPFRVGFWILKNKFLGMR